MGNSGLRRIFYPLDYVDTPQNFLKEFSVMDLEKKEVSLEEICDGKMTLVVNLASDNRLSGEIIKNLNEIKSAFSDSGLEILGFPCNQFGYENSDFSNLRENYKSANFPIFAKTEVNGVYLHPVYKFLKRRSRLYEFALQGAYKIDHDFSMVKQKII